MKKNSIYLQADIIGDAVLYLRDALRRTQMFLCHNYLLQPGDLGHRQPFFADVRLPKIFTVFQHTKSHKNIATRPQYNFKEFVMIGGWINTCGYTILC